MLATITGEQPPALVRAEFVNFETMHRGAAFRAGGGITGWIAAGLFFLRGKLYPFA